MFDDFDRHLKRQGYLAMGGQIIPRFVLWASIVPVPKQRNRRADNAKLEADEVPAGWAKQPAKRAPDARWTKKHGQSHFGYKNHVNVDRRHKLVRRYGRLDARQPSRRRHSRPGQHGIERLGGQRLPLGRDRGEAG